MKSRSIAVYLVFLIFLAACSGSPSLPAEAHRSGGPVSTGWEIADQPIGGGSELTIAVHAMEISTLNTKLLYAATGTRAAELGDPGTTIQMHDEQGRISKLISRETIAVSLGEIKFGRLVFTKRPFGGQNLVLQISRDSADKTLLEGLVARVTGEPEDQFTYANSDYLIHRWQETNLGGYRLSSEGWGPPPSQAAIPTEMLFPKGVTGGDAATLRIQDLQSQQIYYLFMRFPSTFETKAVLIPSY